MGGDPTMKSVENWHFFFSSDEGKLSEDVVDST